MATIIGSITINEISLCEIDSNPTITGLDLPVGSIAINTNTGTIYSKTGNGIYNWTESYSNPNLSSNDVFLNFDGAISVNIFGSFKIPSQIGVRIKKSPTKKLDINGSLTVSSNGRFIIGNNSIVTLRSL
jgi:hypothetical protein